MPESKSDRSRMSNEEVANFLAHGDARGLGWLLAHPEARERAERHLRQIAQGQAEHPPS